MVSTVVAVSGQIRFYAGLFSAYLAGMLMWFGCATPDYHPKLNDIYDQSAQSMHLDRNPVIVIPGLLGTRLTDEISGKVVWGAYEGNFADPRHPNDARLISVPMAKGVAIEDLWDSVEPAGVLDRLPASIAGVPVQLDAYAQILSALGVTGGYRDRSLGLSGAVDYGEGHFTCFQFGYDWRRDNVYNAQKFHQFLLETRAYVRNELKERYGVEDADVKFDVVAHSMGGLLARYYLRYGDAPLPTDGSLPELTWEGADLVDRLILVGPPNAGAVEAVTNLVGGVRFSRLTPNYPPALIGTMPATYQLMPRLRHGLVQDSSGQALNLYDIETWKRFEWGLADPAEDPVLQKMLPHTPSAEARRDIALDHLRKSLARAEQFHRALDMPARPPEGVAVFLMAGDAVDTAAVVRYDETRREFEVLENWPGDGTVLRASALLDERMNGAWTATLNSPIKFEHVQFLFADHLGLTKDPAFTDNVLYLLLEDPRT